MKLPPAGSFLPSPRLPETPEATWSGRRTNYPPPPCPPQPPSRGTRSRTSGTGHRFYRILRDSLWGRGATTDTPHPTPSSRNTLPVEAQRIMWENCVDILLLKRARIETPALWTSGNHVSCLCLSVCLSPSCLQLFISVLYLFDHPVKSLAAAWQMLTWSGWAGEYLCRREGFPPSPESHPF